MMGTVHGERERRTLAFVLALPATPRDVGLAKVVAAFVIFLIPGVLATSPLVLVSRADGGFGFFACAVGAWLSVFAIVLATAVVTESIGATIAALIGLIFVGGNAMFQVAPHSTWMAGYLRAIVQGGGLARPLTLVAETALIGVVVGVMLWLQGRKTSFV